WSHYRFRQRLLAKAREYPRCKVVLVDEAHTSKTCGCCGVLNQKLGGSKVFLCLACRARCDRDLHAARNILLRYLSDVPPGVALGPTPSPPSGAACRSESIWFRRARWFVLM